MVIIDRDPGDEHHRTPVDISRDLIEFCQREMAKLVNGSTLAKPGSGSLGLASLMRDTAIWRRWFG